MSTVDGLPAHILLNHLVVVLGPLAAILAILCALWPAARQRLIWLTLVLTAITLIVTPLTANSGAWLGGKVGSSPAIETHETLGETLAYFVAALAFAVILLTALHVRKARGHAVKSAVQAVIAVLVIGAAAATLFQTYRVGESGARAAWGSVASAQ
jgi:ABC-type branched-subunit amino acid transport system permease subunit